MRSAQIISYSHEYSATVERLGTSEYATLETKTIRIGLIFES